MPLAAPPDQLAALDAELDNIHLYDRRLEHLTHQPSPIRRRFWLQALIEGFQIAARDTPTQQSDHDTPGKYALITTTPNHQHALVVLPNALRARQLTAQAHDSAQLVCCVDLETGQDAQHQLLK